MRRSRRRACVIQNNYKSVKYDRPGECSPECSPGLGRTVYGDTD